MMFHIFKVAAVSINRMGENKIKRVYGEGFFDGGKDYFKDGRVLNVVKFGNKLFGEVIGTERYKTEVKLDDKTGLSYFSKGILKFTFY